MNSLLHDDAMEKKRDLYSFDRPHRMTKPLRILRNLNVFRGQWSYQDVSWRGKILRFCAKTLWPQRVIVQSGLFDPDYYLKRNPEVAASGVNPLTHFLCCGGKEGRNPSPFFDIASYLQTYPDVQYTDMNPLIHYLLYGQFEGRNPKPDPAYELQMDADGRQYDINSRLHDGSMKKKGEHWISLTDQIERDEPTQEELEQQRRTKFTYAPKISIITPTYNTPKQFLIEMIESVMAQTYPNWELCLADGASQKPHVQEILAAYAQKDRRIRVKYLRENQGITGNSIEALSFATGEFITFLDHDDTFAPCALFEVVAALSHRPEADFLYSDEDKLFGTSGRRQEPFLKPDWSPDTLRSFNYPIHVSVLHKNLLSRIGGLRLGFDGSQDYDLVLRATEQAQSIVHIPKILYHWRIHEDSTAGDSSAKLYAIESAKKALREHLERQGIAGNVENGLFPTSYKIIYKIQRTPKVSIMLLNKDQTTQLQQCLGSIIVGGAYQNFEILVIDYGSLEKETFDFYDSLKEHKNIACLTWDQPLNYSAIYAFAAKHAHGDCFVFLSIQTKVIQPDWLERMLEHANRPEIGAVGAKLYYPDDTIHHAGIRLEVAGSIGYPHRFHTKTALGYQGRLQYIHNVSAVTGDCLMVRKKLFEDVGGFDAHYRSTFYDIDFCLKLRQMGYLNVWTPYAELSYAGIRDESQAAQEDRRHDEDLFCRMWQDVLAQGDPYYNPNLAFAEADSSLQVSEHSVNDPDNVRSMAQAASLRYENVCKAAPTPRQFSVLYLDGVGVGDNFVSYRYRISNLREALQLVGINSEVTDQFRLSQHLQQLVNFDLLVVFRAAWDDSLNSIFEACRALHIPVIYDLDDYVFEPAIATATYVSGISTWTAQQQREYMDGVHRYRQALLNADYFTTSTNYLAERARELGKEAFVIPNALSQALLERTAELRLRAVDKGDTSIEIVYISGTQTHQADFAMIVPALARVLQEHPHVRLFIFGYLDLEAFQALRPFETRIRTQPFVKYEQMHHYLQHAHINLAPLEIGNPFCEAKSALKYFEGAAYGLVSVVSATDSFKQAIISGQTGYVCQTEDEWYAALITLIKDKATRVRLTRNAMRHAINHYHPARTAQQSFTTYKTIIKQYRARLNIPERTLSISWIVPAIIPGSGGHNDIFMAANEMAKRGHQVTVYFTKMRAEEYTPKSVKKYLEKHFGYAVFFDVIIGTSAVKSCDALIATHYLTAHELDKLRAKTYLPTYFVQDFEPYFNPVGSEYFEAEVTYQRNFLFVTLGPWLARVLREKYGARAKAVNFWVDREYYFPPKKRIFGKAAKPKVIFFARPPAVMFRRCFALGMKALEEFHRKLPHAHIILFGTNELKHYPIHFPYRDRGILTRAQLGELYRTADVGLIFSTTNPSLVIFEAMACGLPIVDLDVLDSYARHGQNYPAFLTPADPKMIANALYYIVTQPEKRAELSQKSLAFTKDLASSEEALRQISVMIEEELYAYEC